MKKMLWALVLIVVGCQQENATPTSPAKSTFDASTSTLVKSGTFVGVAHAVSGKASVYEKSGAFIVLLESFSTENGPDLKVYLSSDEKASNYVKLGNLQSTMGRQSYNVPSGTDVNKYSYVHIWCEQFTVNFGEAKLQ